MKHLFTLLLIFSVNVLTSQEDTLNEDSIRYAMHPRAPQREHHFFVSTALRYGESYHALTSEKYPELVSCLGEHTRNAYFPSAELMLGYHIRNWWDVSIGVQYFETGYDYAATKQLSDTLPAEFAIGCDVYHAVDPKYGFIQANFYDPRFFSLIQEYHPAEAVQKVKLRYYYLGFPIKTELTALLAITTRRGWARVFINGGVTPNYMIKQRYDVSFQKDSWNYVYQDSIGSPAPFIRRWNLSTSVGAGITFVIRENYEVRIEFSRQDQLFDLFNWRLNAKQDYEEKHRVYGGGLSFRYFLR